MNDFQQPTLWGNPADSIKFGRPDPDHCYDVLVVGAGIVGLTTALLAAQVGLSVAVVEAISPGAGTTGRTTGKATVLHGALTAQIQQQYGADAAADYVTANTSGLSLIRDQLAASEVPWRNADAWSYACDATGTDQVSAEASLLQSLGIDAQLAPTLELPFPVWLAVRVADQIQLDPAAYVRHLLHRVQQLHVPVQWPVRVQQVTQSGAELRVHCHDGAILRGRWVVLATLLPIGLRTLAFAESAAFRSYLVAGSTPHAYPEGMYLSVGDGPTRSIRSAITADGQSQLILGGNSHPTGKDLPARRHLDDLLAWGREQFRLHAVTHQWSAQDYLSVDRLPQVGRSPLGPENLLIATGFGKWGLTNGSAAAQALVGTIVGEPLPWAQTLAPRGPANLVTSGLTRNLEVAVDLTAGWLTDPAVRPDDLREGDGVIARSARGKPLARSMIAGQVRECSAVCPHLGGIVRWNNVERSWDCPLHGSRFDPEGNVLQGPAVTGLTPPSRSTTKVGSQMLPGQG